MGYDYDYENCEYGYREVKPKQKINLDKSFKLPEPHYSNPYWNEARLVWGEKASVDFSEYSDRLYQRTGIDLISKATKDKGISPGTVRYYEELLSQVYESPVEMVYVYAGVNLSSGYYYYCFGSKKI